MLSTMFGDEVCVIMKVTSVSNLNVYLQELSGKDMTELAKW